MHFKILIVIAIFTTSLIARSTPIESHWKKSDIVVDGIVSEWSEPFSQLPDNENWSLDVKNDSNNLYLCLISTDRDINRQMMMSGFAVTFEGTLKNKEAIFGVRFPIGMMLNNGMHSRNDQNHDPDAMREQEEQMLHSLEIVGPNKNDSKPMGVAIADSFGIKVKCVPVKDSLVYELQVPLKKGTAITGEIDITKKASIRVTLETIQPDFVTERRPSAGGMNGAPRNDGMGGLMASGANKSGPPSGRAPGRRLNFSSYFKSSLIIKLASNSAAK